MMELPLVFPLEAGLHARPASLLREQAARFRSVVTFVNETNGARADARSTLELVSTGTAGGDVCVLRIGGEDAPLAFAALRRFITEVLPHADDGAMAPPRPVPGLPLVPRALRGAPCLTGQPVSPGIARGRACLLSIPDPFSMIPDAPAGTPAEEEARFHQAVGRIAAELEKMLQARPGGARAAILRTHLSIVHDHGFARKVSELLEGGTTAAGRAVAEAARHFEAILRKAGSAYLQERADDIHDIAARLVNAMYGPVAPQSRQLPAGDMLCVAEHLLPSGYVSLDKRYLKGLVLARGGATSHTVILARSEGIPCVTGVHGAGEKIAQGDELVLDAGRGLVMLSPAPGVVRFYELESRRAANREEEVARFVALPGLTADGKRLEVAANAGSLADVQSAFRSGAEGIGLFRTEILFANRTEPPSEEEQTALYVEAVRLAEGRTVVFRTLDAGGDKPLPYIPFPPEDNPFLGYRAVRMYDDLPWLIDTQIKAILRASAHGPVRIIVPMITSVAEIRSVRERVRRCAAALAAAGTPCDGSLPVGIMIEVPAVLYQMEQFGRVADFFSIGSNDLTQYLLAVDRGNDKVARLYNAWHPALLRGLELAVQGAHRCGRWIGICGEMAGWEAALPLLVGLGLDEISVGPARIPWLKAALHRLSSVDCAGVAAAALASETAEDAETILRSFLTDERRFELTGPDIVDLHSPARTKEEVINELAGLLEAAGRVDSADLTEEDIWLREDTYPTGMGHGIAIPHCKSPHVRVPSVALLRAAEPVVWSAGEDPVVLAILIAVPADGAAHLPIIARLSRHLMHEEFRVGLLSATGADEVVRLLGQEHTM